MGEAEVVSDAAWGASLREALETEGQAADLTRLVQQTAETVAQYIIPLLKDAAIVLRGWKISAEVKPPSEDRPLEVLLVAGEEPHRTKLGVWVDAANIQKTGKPSIKLAIDESSVRELFKPGVGMPEYIVTEAQSAIRAFAVGARNKSERTQALKAASKALQASVQR